MPRATPSARRSTRSAIITTCGGSCSPSTGACRSSTATAPSSRSPEQCAASVGSWRSRCRVGASTSTRHQWTADELAYLRAHYPTTLPTSSRHWHRRRIAARPSSWACARPPAIARMARERSSAPGHGGQHPVPPGQRPWNRARTSPARLARPQFKPGQSTAAPPARAATSARRINGDGYLDRKVSDLPGPPHRRWHPAPARVGSRARPRAGVTSSPARQVHRRRARDHLDRVELITAANSCAATACTPCSRPSWRASPNSEAPSRARSTAGAA